MDSTETITAVSFCTGYAGLDLGIRRVVPGFRVIAYSEIEAYACANLVAKMEAGLLDAAPIWTNLKTFPSEQFRGLVDILTAGYPCQPESCAGKKMGKEDSRWLWPYILRSVHVIRPRICFFENVEGHITGGLRSVLTDISSIGYRVAGRGKTPTWGIFSAAEVGAPHRRKRVFILAYRKDCARWIQLQAWHKGTGSESSGSGGELADAGCERRQQIPGGSSGNEKEDGRERRDELEPNGDHNPGSESPVMADTRCDSSETRGQNGSLRNASQGGIGHNDGGESVAESNSELHDGRGIDRTGRWGQHPDGGTELGHATSDEQQRNTMPGIYGEGITAGGSGGDVANSECPERRPEVGLRDGAEQRSETGRIKGASGIGECSRELATTTSSGSQERRGEPRDIREERPATQRSLPEFPPGPNDHESWRGIPEHLWPSTAKSKLHGLASRHSPGLDPSEFRVDRLRAAGNGVVPATAAKAFRTLITRI